MKFTVAFITLLSISSSWAIKVKKSDDPKDKREAPVGYPASGHSSHSFQAPSLGHNGANSISIGAGYSVGGAKPSFAYSTQGGGAPLQISSENLPASGHATIQLPPITLQPNHGGYASNDLSELMSQLSHGLNTGALSLQPAGASGGESYFAAAQGAHGGQEYVQQYAEAAPAKLQQYAVSEQSAPSVPSYAAGTKGLGQYSTGPVLFNPADSQSNAPSVSYGAPSSGHSFGDIGSIAVGGAGHSLGGSGGYSLGGSGHSLGGSLQSLGGSGHSLSGSGHSLGGSGHSFGGSGHSLGGSGHSLGGSGHSLRGPAHSFGGSGHSLAGLSLGGSGHSFGSSGKGLSGGFILPSKSNFKPSAFLGASVQGDSGHGLSGLSGSYGAPSFGGFHGGSQGGLSLSSLSSNGHGASFGGSLGSFGGGSSKFIAPSYLPPKSEGFGSSLESVAAFASNGHLASPPGTTYGVPSSSYGVPSSAVHAASSHSPQYYLSTSKYSSPASFGEGSSSFKGPISGHSSLSSYSGPKYSFGGHSSPSSRYGAPKDIQGAHSETSYNTIKYSEELKPHTR